MSRTLAGAVISAGRSRLCEAPFDVELVAPGIAGYC